MCKHLTLLSTQNKSLVFLLVSHYFEIEVVGTLYSSYDMHDITFHVK